jgi:hypothetical protein
MKVEVIEKEKQKYPFIGKAWNGMVVLFYDNEKGIAIAGQKDVGLHLTNWDMNNFEKLKGKVILEND